MRRTIYTVREDQDGFVIRTQWTSATLGIWFGGVVSSVIIWFLSHNLHAPVWLSYTLAATTALIQTLRNVGTFDTCTVITRFEAKPTGKFPNRYAPASFVPLATIVYLTYREQQSRGEDEVLPAGLWAEQERGSTCLVPCLTKDEADALVHRIEDRFRDLIGSAIALGRPSHLTTLGLSTRT